MTTMVEKMIEYDLLPFREREGGFASEWAEYKQALRRVADLSGLDQDGAGPKGLTPLSDLDEAAVALMNAAWQAGVVVGDAFARAELTSFAAPRHVCEHCRGYGRRKGEDHDCGLCRGRGLMEGERLN